MNWPAIGRILSRAAVIILLLWLAAWLLSWHFVRVLGLFVIVLAANISSAIGFVIKRRKTITVAIDARNRPMSPGFLWRLKTTLNRNSRELQEKLDRIL